MAKLDTDTYIIMLCMVTYPVELQMLLAVKDITTLITLLSMRAATKETVLRVHDYSLHVSLLQLHKKKDRSVFLGTCHWKLTS